MYTMTPYSRTLQNYDNPHTHIYIYIYLWCSYLFGNCLLPFRTLWTGPWSRFFFQALSHPDMRRDPDLAGGFSIARTRKHPKAKLCNSKKSKGFETFHVERDRTNKTGGVLTLKLPDLLWEADSSTQGSRTHLHQLRMHSRGWDFLVAGSNANGLMIMNILYDLCISMLCIFVHVYACLSYR